MAGIGKSSIMRNTTNFLWERGFYNGGILYLNVSKVMTLKGIIDIIKYHIQADSNYKV